MPVVPTPSMLTAVPTASNYLFDPTIPTPSAINVKAYGALGNGVQDDAVFIQAALDAATAAGGGQVYFPAGTYLVGASLILYSKVHLVGSGIESTIIKMKNSSNVDVLKSLNFASLTGTDTNAGNFNWSVQDLTVDGNRSHNSTGYGLRVYGYGYILHNFRVRNCPNDGIYTEWSKTVLGGTSGDGTMEAHWTNIMSHDNGGNGVTMAGPHDSKWVNGSVFSNDGKGVYVKNNAVMTGGGLFATNVHSWGNTQTYAWDIEDEVRCINCAAEGASLSQVRLGSSGNDLYKASLASWLGGQVFSASGSGIGFEVGGGGFSPIGLHINTSLFNCSTACVKFSVASAGGHNIRFVTYQTSGPVVLGTAHASDYIEAIVSGGGGPTSIIQTPVSITVPQNSGLITAVTTDQIRLKPGGTTAFGATGKTNAVNYPVANPATAGNGIGLFAEGSDSTIGFDIVGKGVTSSISLRSDFSTESILEAKGVASAVNRLLVTSAATGQGVSVKAFSGIDTNVDLKIGGQGTGLVQIDYASTALGGGSAATFGTVGGAGPATAAQFKWLAIRDSNDGIVFIPIWH